MRLRRVGWLAVTALSTLLWISCGEVYRPVVLPIATTPPNPASFHAVFAINSNVLSNPGTALQIDVSGDSEIGAGNAGINPTHLAILPNHSHIFVASAGSVNSDGSINPGGADVVTSFTPATDSPTATGMGAPAIYTLPTVGPNQTAVITGIQEASGGVVTVTLSSSLVSAAVGGLIVISGVPIAGYDGSFTMTSVSGTTIQYLDPTQGLGASSGGTAAVPVPTFCSYQPDFVATAQNNVVYVANFGFENAPDCHLASTDSVALLNAVSGTISNIAYLATPAHPVAHPVGLVETPDAQNLYVLNQGSATVPGTIMDLSPTDLSTLATISLPPGSSLPIWAVSRVDAKKVYVVTQGDGSLLTVDTATNTVTSIQSVGGVGASFVFYDNSRNRLYVTNPVAGAVYVFDATTDPPTPIGTPTGAISIPVPPIPATPACASATCSYSAVSPASVAPLPDGSRFYVASYVTAAPGSPCPDPNVTAAQCVIPQVTVFDAASLTVKSTIFPIVPQLTTPAQNIQPFSIAPNSPFCPAVPGAAYSPAGPARFRMSAAAAADSTHVYASMCDAGLIADIATVTSAIATGGTNTPDTLITDMATPFGAGPLGSNNEPLLQSPTFLLTGQ